MVTIGQTAPAIELPDQTGETRTLNDFTGQWVALYFYPKDDTPGCTTEACSFRDNLASLQSKGIAVLGVSADDVKSHQKFAQKFELGFPLLADTDHAVCEAYGAWQEKSMYGKKYWGVARITVLIDDQGVVRHVFEKVKPDGHALEVLNKVVELRGS
ncbi:MAG: thioredoxin-dependent thiol peroxidase [Fimbriimonadia bacterium]|nr:thioredoxin-dependent thiol peroxidase [Fimbriimonadia bacterium]